MGLLMRTLTSVYMTKRTLASIACDLLGCVGGLVLIFFTTLPPAFVVLAHHTLELRGNVKRWV